VIIFLWGSIVGALLAGHEKGAQPLFATIAGPLAMYLVGLVAYVYNDIRDLDADRINAGHRPLPSGRVSKGQAMELVITSGVLALTLSLLLNPLVFAVAAFGIFLAYIYSTPPFSLKNYAISKWVVASLWAGVASLGGSLAVSKITGKTLYAAILFTVQGLACSPLADLMDITGDRMAGKKTIAVVLGPSLTVKMSLALMASSLVFTTFIFNSLGFNWLFPILLWMFSAMLIRWTLPLSNRYTDKVFCRGLVKKICLASMALNTSLVIGVL
jgi:4-hydroxybenzoate polyprenyltransferase